MDCTKGGVEVEHVCCYVRFLLLYTVARSIRIYVRFEVLSWYRMYGVFATVEMRGKVDSVAWPWLIFVLFV